jgi:hypothetical protein
MPGLVRRLSTFLPAFKTTLPLIAVFLCGLSMSSAQNTSYPYQYNFWTNFVEPSLSSIDSQGNLYINDVTNNQTIKEVPLGGGQYTQTVVAKRIGGAQADSLGNVYIVNGLKVYKESPSGSAFVESLYYDFNTNSTFKNWQVPSVGVVIGPSDVLYFAFFGSNPYTNFAAYGTFPAGGGAPTIIRSGNNFYVRNLKVDSNGDIYWYDIVSESIYEEQAMYEFTTKRTFYTQRFVWSQGNNAFDAFDVDSSGNVYVLYDLNVSYSPQQISVLVPSAGNYTAEIVSLPNLPKNSGGTTSYFYYALNVDAAGNLYIPCSTQVFTGTGSVTYSLLEETTKPILPRPRPGVQENW